MNDLFNMGLDFIKGVPIAKVAEYAGYAVGLPLSATGIISLLAKPSLTIKIGKLLGNIVRVCLRQSNDRDAMYKSRWKGTAYQLVQGFIQGWKQSDRNI